MLISVGLATTLFPPDHILRLCPIMNELVIFVYLQAELASMTQDNHPLNGPHTKNSQWVESAYILVLLYCFQNFFLASHQSSRVTEINFKILIFSQKFEISGWLFLLVKQAKNEPFIDLKNVSSFRVVNIDPRLIVIEPIKLLQKFKILFVFRELLERNFLSEYSLILLSFHKIKMVKSW